MRARMLAACVRVCVCAGVRSCVHVCNVCCVCVCVYVRVHVLSREVVWRGVGWDKEGGEREEIREEEGK